MNKLEPSALIRRFGSKIAAASLDKPILDVACGSGRNALYLWRLGCTVICVDRDLSDLQAQLPHGVKSDSGSTSNRIILHQLDLKNDPWPFTQSSVGGIINVHFTLPSLFPFFESSLVQNGFLLIETVPGCGENYRELPRKGELKAVFEESFAFDVYKEGLVGPDHTKAVTVKLLARRRYNNSC
jgi:tellurite methyltransferase